MNRFVSALVVAVAVLALGAIASLTVSGDTSDLPLRSYTELAEAGIPPVQAVERAASMVNERDGESAAISFLTNHVYRFPDDPANGYYILLVGDHYHNKNADPVARHYYRRALLAHPDASIRGMPLHKAALERLVLVSPTSEERASYLESLLHRYPNQIDRGLVAFRAAQQFEAAGSWNQAQRYYEEFMRLPDTQVPGQPHARADVEHRLALAGADIPWTHRELNTLVTQIRTAIATQDVSRLLRARSRASFFAMSSQQEEFDPNSDIPSFDVGAFLRRSRVRAEPELEMASNANEAYLRTTGWSHRIPTWYLYFRRVSFPTDPEVHGSWEWAGIFFGETL